MRLAVTGYVSADSGSVAGANALLLPGLLEAGHEVVFFSKSSFVDPRPVVDARPALRAQFAFVEADNRLTDRLRARGESVPFLGRVLRVLDAAQYHRLLVQRMAAGHAARPFDVVLWLGDYARGGVPGVPCVSFAQGPPGTDARSVLRRWGEIRRFTSPWEAWGWWVLSHLRLSPLGLPPLRFSDRVIVGSRQSAGTLAADYRFPRERIDILPYPVDPGLFRPPAVAPVHAPGGPLRVLWLGRIIPRKRLDVFLDGACEAVRRGVDLRLTVVGSASGLIRGYRRMIEEFPMRGLLTHLASVPRAEVPALFARHDVLVQPSEEENFGSSVAEAQACGLPVVVGSSNGNADYLCERDIRLKEDSPAALADALEAIRAPSDPRISRRHAEQTFAPDKITAGLIRSLETAAAASRDEVGD
jgi:glycosyltransferase involved in cell wall biosynthesis